MLVRMADGAGGGGGGLEEEMDRWMTAIRHLPQRTSALELTGVAQAPPLLREAREI